MKGFHSINLADHQELYKVRCLTHSTIPRFANAPDHGKIGEFCAAVGLCSHVAARSERPFNVALEAFVRVTLLSRPLTMRLKCTANCPISSSLSTIALVCLRMSPDATPIFWLAVIPASYLEVVQ